MMPVFGVTTRLLRYSNLQPSRVTHMPEFAERGHESSRACSNKLNDVRLWSDHEGSQVLILAAVTCHTMPEPPERGLCIRSYDAVHFDHEWDTEQIMQKPAKRSSIHTLHACSQTTASKWRSTKWNTRSGRSTRTQKPTSASAGE